MLGAIYMILRDKVLVNFKDSTRIVDVFQINKGQLDALNVQLKPIPINSSSSTDTVMVDSNS